MDGTYAIPAGGPAHWGECSRTARDLVALAAAPAAADTAPEHEGAEPERSPPIFRWFLATASAA